MSENMSREAMQMALDMLNEIADDVYCDQKLEGVIAVLRQALVDVDDTSQKRVDEMVKTEHDRAVELGKAYERGWNAALAQREWVPEALRLADALDAEFVQGRISNSTGRESAVELRRLYEVNQDLLKALNTILNISLIDNGHWAKTIEREAHEAIAKATGGEV